MKKTFLVTGSCGFIGFHISKRLLEQGHDVIGVDNINNYYDIKLKNKRNSILKKFSGYRFIKLDISKYKKFITIKSDKSIDTIIHMAAQAGVRYSIENPHVYAESNYIGTLNVLEYAKLNGIKRVVYASSSSVYGLSKTPHSEQLSSTDTPMSVYAATKKAKEVLAFSYSHLHDMTTVGLRYFTVYGEWSRPDMAMMKFAKKILVGEEITLYNNGNMRRGFTHIDDIVDGVMEAVKIKQGNHLINLGGDQQVNIKSMVKLLEQHLGHKAKITYTTMQPGDIKETHASQDEAIKKLKFKPKIKFEHGVESFCKWILENKELILSLENTKQ